MALRSQLITKEFPDLDRVERLNNEAFPEEERIPLSEFLQLDGRDDYHFFAFYDEDD
ncbi:MAG: N-acetyltransferase, partial [Streptococcus vestibularis]|nr:N-acetyltransferase [Streptococcus vestibularis]